MCTEHSWSNVDYVWSVSNESYLWQETWMDLWWDLGTPQHSPELLRSLPLVLFVGLQPENVTPLLCLYEHLILAASCGHSPARSSSRSGTWSWTFSVLLTSAISGQAVVRGQGNISASTVRLKYNWRVKSNKIVHARVHSSTYCHLVYILQAVFKPIFINNSYLETISINYTICLNGLGILKCKG